MIARRIALLALALTAAGGMGRIIGSDSDDRYADCRAGQVAGGSLGGALELVNSAGETVTDKEIFTEPTILYFGYTYCPDICPFDTARNALAVEILEDRGYTANPAFISIDPERDTPEIVGGFAEALHPRMIGLTGSAEQIAAASKAYRTYYAKAPGGTEDDYLVDHSTHSYLVMPDEGYVEFFRRDISAEDMADRVQCFMDAR